MEAAERRQQENEKRGIKNPEKVRQMQEKAARIEKEEIEAAKRGTGEPTLRVRVNPIPYNDDTNSKQHNLFLFILFF